MNRLKTGDKVKVMRGKEAGKEGELLKIVRVKDRKGVEKVRVVVGGINKVKRHQKPNPTLGLAGGVIEIEKPIDISNVMLIDPKLNVPTRVGVKVDEKTGKKVRFAKKSGQTL
ncbi:MAG: 50S ribosomal protein L24 [Candidatus Doudnabacteria bacterium]|nr:50S ribosomal protein L24 [Candidatus Doudnabacteria bacterium]